VIRKERQKQSIAEIDALVRAIAKRDVAKARRAAETHVENSAKSAFIAAADKAELESKIALKADTASAKVSTGAR
jgi:DNA-binding GntR family transcriptional regulator